MSAGPSSSSERILIRLPNWLGDLVACLPLVDQAARTLGPNLTLVAPKPWHGVLADLAPKARLFAPTRSLRDASWQDHQQALLLDGSFRSASQAWWAGIGVRVGLQAGGRAVCLNGGVMPVRERGAAPLSQNRRLWGSRRSPRPFGSTASELLALLPGRPAGFVQDPRPRFVPGEPALEQAQNTLVDLGIALGEPFVLLNLGGRVGSSKGIPVGLAAGLAAELGGRRIPTVAICGPGEEERLRSYVLALTNQFPVDGPLPRCWPDAPPDLPLLGALGALAAVTVTPDGGGRHLLRAAGATCLSLFGPTDPRHSANPGPPEISLVGVVPCGPCHLELCPLDGEQVHRCWGVLSPEALVKGVVELLRAGSTQA